MRIGCLIVIGGVLLPGSCLAQWAVVDAANLSQNITNYAILVQQIAKQAEQITNQVHQIQQMDHELKRLGNMADVTGIAGLQELRVDLSLPASLRAWSDTVATVNGAGLFGDTRGGVFSEIDPEFADFDGAAIPREADIYKPAREMTIAVDDFKNTQTDAYARRQHLLAAIAQTSAALQAAQTDAEEKKLAAVLNAQYGELAAVDSQVRLSAAQIQAQAAEAATMNDAQQRADAEARSQLAQEEATKIGATFKPIYDSILTYVREEPFRP